MWRSGPSLEGRCSSLHPPLASAPRLPVSRAKAKLPRGAEVRGSDLTADLRALAVKHRPPFPVPPSWAREAERSDLGYPSPQPGSLGLEVLYVLGRKPRWRGYGPRRLGGTIGGEVGRGSRVGGGTFHRKHELLPCASTGLAAGEMRLLIPTVQSGKADNTDGNK